MTDKAMLRRVIRFGPFTLNVDLGELRNGPTRLKVPDQSIAVLLALLEQPGELVTREALRDRLWGADTFVDFEAGLNAAVRRLREALHDSADQPRYIETLPRRGYRFIAPVEGVFAGAALGPADPGSDRAAANVGGDVAPQPSLRPENTGVRSARMWRAALAFFGLAVIAAGLWVGLGRRNSAPTELRPLPVTRLQGLELDPAISPSGTFVAFAWEGEGGNNFDIYVHSIDGNSRLQLTKDAAAEHAPAWSPDGQRIAFVRDVGGKREIIVAPVFGGVEQRLFEAGPDAPAWFLVGDSYGLSWTPDGKHLVFSDESGSTSAIFLYSFEDGQKRQLTRPPAKARDSYPVVSPNGQSLAFVRANRVFVQKLDQLQPVGEPTTVTSRHAVMAFDWTQDSRSIVYNNAGSVDPGLWRIATTGGDPEIVLPNISAVRPSVARSGTGMVYQNTSIDSNIWELPVPASNRSASGAAPFRVIASTSIDMDMRLSPDETRIAFASGRSGSSELWVSNRDGSQPKRLTSFEGGGRVGSPCWSGNGEQIAFDAIQTGTGNWNLYLVTAGGGPVRALTSDSFDNIRPSWSSDGRWIYFASNRNGSWQIWRMTPVGGVPEQITRQGGSEPIVSPDGQHVYYAKGGSTEGIWKVPADGRGPEVKVVEQGRVLSFDVAETGIFIMDTLAKPQATINMFSFALRRVVPIARFEAGGGGRFTRSAYLNVSRDGHSILFTQYDQRMSDVEMLREFR